MSKHHHHSSHHPNLLDENLKSSDFLEASNSAEKHNESHRALLMKIRRRSNKALENASQVADLQQRVGVFPDGRVGPMTAEAVERDAVSESERPPEAGGSTDQDYADVKALMHFAQSSATVVCTKLEQLHEKLHVDTLVAQGQDKTHMSALLQAAESRGSREALMKAIHTNNVLSASEHLAHVIQYYRSQQSNG